MLLAMTNSHSIRVTQIADHLRIDFALIHRERYHIRHQNEETEKMETRITLVGDVKNKIALMLVSFVCIICRMRLANLALG